MKRIFLLSALISAFCFPLYSQPDELPVVEIGELSTTHILFTTDLTYVDISTPDVVAIKVVEASQNMLAIKAKKPFDFTTTISALETNGTMHTLRVRFNLYPENLLIDLRPNAKQNVGAVVNTQVRPDEADAGKESVKTSKGDSDRNGRNDKAVSSAAGYERRNAPTLEEVMRKEQQIFHIGDRNFNVEAYCSNIFVYNDITYIVLNIKNKTDISFDAGEAQFSIESLKPNRKSLGTSKQIAIKSSHGTLSCGSRGEALIGYSLNKLTLLKNECLRIYIYERSGNRNLVLTLSDKDINYAVSPR